MNENIIKYSNSIKHTSDGWCLNPGTSFELTVLHTTENIAQSIRDICDNESCDERESQLFYVLASNNIVIKEIEEYIEKYSSVYNVRLNQLIDECADFNQMDIKDKEVLMKSFRSKALDSIYELPDFDIDELFVEHDLTIDDELIEKYGLNCLDVYFSWINKIGCVVNMSVYSYNRKEFEQMSLNGLAVHGKDIPIKNVLESLTIKELNEIADTPGKTFRRKDQAIEYILDDAVKLSSIEERIDFNELFMLIPLKDISDIEIDKIINLWKYYKIESRLILHTFTNSIYWWEKLNNNQEACRRRFSSYSVSSTNTRCRCAQERMKYKYPLDNAPKTPCHIGCSCWINYNRD